MEKKHYIAPSLTVVTFKTERGYALSGDPQAFSMITKIIGLTGPIELSSSSTQESWGEIDEITFGDSWDF